MELFTLGIGPYSEDDVKQAARALTGWKLVDDEARFVPVAARRGHQDDPRPHRRVRRRRPGRVAPGASRHVPPPGLAALPRVPRRGGGRRAGDRRAGRGAAGPRPGHRLGRRDGAPLAPVLRRRQPGPARRRARSSYVVGAVRALEMLDPAPSTPVLADWCGRLGQDLFYPPNVGGWPGGRSWITTRSAIGRANFAAALVGASRSA